MIKCDEGLQLVREQMNRIEDALLSLRRTVLPRNARNYAVFAEAYIDQILVLRAEIDEYLGLSPVTAPATPPLQAVTVEPPALV